MTSGTNFKPIGQPSSDRNAAIPAASRPLRRDPKSRATAAADRHQACKIKTTNPGGGKESIDHASARAGVRIAATPARAALVPCDILKTCRRVVNQAFYPTFLITIVESMRT